MTMDIIKTIEDDEEIENLSEDSDVEVEVSEKFNNYFNTWIFELKFMFFFSINQQNRRH